MTEYIGIDARSFLRWLDGEIDDACDGVLHAAFHKNYREADRHQLRHELLSTVKTEFQNRIGTAKNARVIDVGQGFITIRVAVADRA